MQRNAISILLEFSTKRRNSAIVDWDNRWKFFYSSADSSMYAQAGVEILTSHQIPDSEFDWIPLGLPACMLKLSKESAIVPIAGVCSQFCKQISGLCG